MADAPRQVPAQYGPVRAVFRPRLGSYGRRLLACLPPLLVAALGLGWLAARRPAPGAAALVLAVVVVAGALCYGYLRPALVVLTGSHVLRARTVGFAATERARVAEVVTVGALLREGPRRPGPPRLWAADARGRRLLELDGTVWDARTLDELAVALGGRRTRFERASVQELSRRWPRLVPWRLRHPRLRSAASSAGLLAVVALAVWLSTLPRATGA